MGKVWVVVGESESGDDYLHVFGYEPSEKRLEDLAHDWDGDEDNEGPGSYGSYVYLCVDEYEVENK